MTQFIIRVCEVCGVPLDGRNKGVRCRDCKEFAADLVEAKEQLRLEAVAAEQRREARRKEAEQKKIDELKQQEAALLDTTQVPPWDFLLVPWLRLHHASLPSHLVDECVAKIVAVASGQNAHVDSVPLWKKLSAPL